MDTLGRFGELARTSEPALDLGHAAFLIAQIEHPALEPERELARLDALAARVGQGDVHHLRCELFEKEGFAGNADDYYDPRNSCLNDVLDRRLGIPITLSILAMEVGRRLGLTVRGIGLPGHFMVAADGVLFDPFNGGAAVSRDEAAAVVARVLGKPVALGDDHFTPVTKSQILVRMLANLRGVYVERQAWAKARAVMERLMLLDPAAPGHVRDYGTVLMKEGNFTRGAAQWELYLERNPSARDAERVKAQLIEIRRAIASLN
ncbi:MAG: transglutaminase family protein [Candidatus Rokubacteria bacterium]|nr:transglutaminase family protein [Candidatus Rokubacteria bacterium]